MRMRGGGRGGEGKGVGGRRRKGGEIGKVWLDIIRVRIIREGRRVVDAKEVEELFDKGGCYFNAALFGVVGRSHGCINCAGLLYL